jgi:3'-5' exoribonuclease
MIPKTFIQELTQNAHVRTSFLVTQKAVRSTRTGSSYLSVTLGDRTGTIEARAWEAAELLDQRFDAHDFVVVQAQVTSYQGTLQLKIVDIDRLDTHEVEPADYFPTSRWDAEAMFAQLKDLVLDHVRSPDVLAFLRALFGDDELMARFKRAPAAKANHHNWLGGLLEHVLSMARVGAKLADHYSAYYPGLIDKDLVLAGCILHDMGKCRELSYDRGIDYTTHGQLIGHIPHGIELVNDVAARTQPAPPESLLMHLKHLVLSHHGRLDYGSPVVPRTPEAMLLHEIDMIDSRMNMIHGALSKHAGRVEASSPWTEYNRALQTRLFAGDPAEQWRRDDAHPESSLMGPGTLYHDVEPLELPPISPTRAPPPGGAKRPRDPARSALDDAPGTLNLFGD